MRNILLVTTLACVLVVGQVQAATKTEGYVTKLCDATVTALQKTDAQPLAALFSAQTSSFLVAQGDKAIHLGRARLLKMDKWSDKAEFTSKAKAGEIKMVDRAYAVRVSAKVADGDKNFLIDGVSTREGDGHRWLMLAVLPEKPEPTQADTDDFNGKLQAIFASWRQGLANGDTGPMLSSLAEEDVAVCVIGPDYGFYTFATASEFQAALQQVSQIGGVKLTGADVMTGPLRSPIAALTGQWSLSVAMMQPASQDLWVHLFLDKGQWKVAGLCAMPSEQ